MSRKRKIGVQRGMTLVELMIAMVVGLLLLAGVIQIFLSGKQSYRTQEGLSRLQENGRFAMDVFALNLRHAGFKPNALSRDDLEFSIDTNAVSPTNASFGISGQTVAGTDNNGSATDLILNGSDTLTFRFRGTGSAVQAPLADCLGESPATADTMIVNTLYIRDDPATALAERELHCRNSAGSDQPLLDGVEGMQVLYGVDTNGDQTANRYSIATDVTGNQWSNIVSVRIALLLNTVQDASSDLDTNTYALLNNAAVGPFNDRLRRHVFTTTIALRNKLP